MTTATHVPIEQRHAEFLKTVQMPLGVAIRWHNHEEIAAEDRTALLESVRGLEAAYRGMIPALAECSADDDELAVWILAAQSLARTIEAVENNRPAFVVAPLEQLADWHERVAQPYTLTDLVWNVREAKALLDRRFIDTEKRRDDSAEHRRQQLEVARDCVAVINEIASEIAPSAVAQWGQGDIAKPVEAMVESFTRWGVWRTNQPVSAESEIATRAKSDAVDAALSTLDRLLVDSPIAEPKTAAGVRRIKKAELVAKISEVLDVANKSGKKYTISDIAEQAECSEGAVSGTDVWHTKGHGRKRKAKARAVDLSAATLNREAASDDSPEDAERTAILNQLAATASDKERQEMAERLAAMNPDQRDVFFDQAARQLADRRVDETPGLSPRKTL